MHPILSTHAFNNSTSSAARSLLEGRPIRVVSIQRQPEPDDCKGVAVRFAPGSNPYMTYPMCIDMDPEISWDMVMAHSGANGFVIVRSKACKEQHFRILRGREGCAACEALHEEEALARLEIPATPTFTPDGVDLPGSDISVISSDGKIFRVHKSNLMCASETFADMLEVGSGSAEVTLVESGTVLARMLPFAYPQTIPISQLDIISDFQFADALFKYQVAFRGGEKDLSHGWARNLAQKFRGQSSEQIRTQILNVPHVDPDFGQSLALAIIAYLHDSLTLVQRARLFNKPAHAYFNSPEYCVNKEKINMWWTSVEVTASDPVPNFTIIEKAFDALGLSCTCRYYGCQCENKAPLFALKAAYEEAARLTVNLV
ncbi:hypothetical protein P7C70_g2203, partial [Phenoliferia sp. Uapishka_3]